MNEESWQDLDPVEQLVLLHDKMLGVRSRGGGSSGAPPDPEPKTGPKEISTGPVTAVGFASINA
jgi:hypothetical protein